MACPPTATASRATRGAEGLAALLGAVSEAERAINGLARDLFARFLDEVVPAGPADQKDTGLPAGTTSTDPREASSTERAKPLSATRPPGVSG